MPPTAAAFSEVLVQCSGNVGEVKAGISAVGIIGDLSIDPFTNQLYIDAPEPRLLPYSVHTHQQLRIAQNSILLNRHLPTSGLLLTPLATFGGVSVHIRPLPPLLQTVASPQHGELSLDRLVFVCGFCNASFPVADVLSRTDRPENAECTAEFLKVFAREHAVECRGRSAVEQLQEDAAMFGVSESSSHQSVNVSPLKSTLNYNLKCEMLRNFISNHN